jgi:hypothetical protein
MPRIYVAFGTILCDNIQYRKCKPNIRELGMGTAATCYAKLPRIEEPFGFFKDWESATPHPHFNR